MENYLNENFGDVKGKNSSEEALQRWNPKRRFRFAANLSKRFEAEAIRRSNQEKFRVAVLVSQAALRFINGLNLSSEYIVPREVQDAGFEICADELASIVEGRDVKKLKIHGDVEGIISKLATSDKNGIPTSNKLLDQRKEIYGINKFAESPARGFWVFVWEALQNMTLMILAVCALVSLLVGITMEGWPKGAHDGLRIVAGILVLVFVTATSDYKQSLQFKDLDREKKKFAIQVTRNGFRQKISIYDLLPGDIAHLAIGVLVPADGLFVSGFSVLINEFSLTGESEPVNVNSGNPFLLSGTKVLDGSCKMLVTTVGMRTQWGKLLATLSEGGDDETPLQVKLNGVATIIGKVGLYSAIVTFAVLVQGLFSRKLKEGSHWTWSGDEAMEILEFFSVAVTIVVGAVPKGLPSAVTLGLAFAMKKMMNDKALVGHLAACETMGSATSICSDKTGTLTTNHMTVVKACICGKIKEVGSSKDTSSICSEIPSFGLSILLQSIFNNTGGEIFTNEDGKVEILGSPTETALLEFGLLLGGDFESEGQTSKIVKVEPFNSAKKRMAVLLELPGGGHRVHCKGASEIILAACNKVIDSDGVIVALNEASRDHLKDTIERFASEALRTLCLAYMEIENEFSAESPLPIEGYTCIGIVGIEDPVRTGVRESVAICRSAGITARMVTGDNINTAKAIARECGILTSEGIAIEGPVFREKSEEELREIIPKLQVMARSSPMDKHTLVKHLRTTLQEVVAVTGVGTNDAPALHVADIGLAMGIAGTEVAKESADVIILDYNFSTIVTVAKWARFFYIYIQKIFLFLLTVNVVALVVNFSSTFSVATFPPSSSGKSPPSQSFLPQPSSSNTSLSTSLRGMISIGVVVGIAIGGVVLLVVLILLCICCKKWRKNRDNKDIKDYYHRPPPSGPKGGPYSGPQQHWQYNATPPPSDHVVGVIPKPSPLPAVASRPPYSPVNAPTSPKRPPPPPPPQYLCRSGGSNYPGSENPQPPPHPGVVLGFSKSTFTYDELAMATGCFSDANFLGQGGFGCVHRGVLPNGKEVAIKQLKAGSGQGEREFQAEVEIISRVHHKHLVSLVGYCSDEAWRLLVYEFVPNNTLEFHLHGQRQPTMEWPIRLKIALAASKGLAYLHEDCRPTIIHRDIKASNILLDFEFEAKVADFGLAKIASDANTHVSTRVMGTFGYLDPEYASSGRLTDKSDVYSFGVMLLELITGHGPVSLVEWAQPLLSQALKYGNYNGLADPKLKSDYNRNEMARMVACAAACVRSSGECRPRMSQIVRALEGEASLTANPKRFWYKIFGFTDGGCCAKYVPTL